MERKDERDNKEEEEGKHSEIKNSLPLYEEARYTGQEPGCPQICCVLNCRVYGSRSV
jgi:hypothetical protein